MTSSSASAAESRRLPCLLSLPSIEILQFLDLHTAVQLLNTCRSLRGDRILTASVLVRVPCAPHFLEGCAADWWHATPLWKTSIYNSELAADEIDSDWEDDQLLAGQVDDCHVDCAPSARDQSTLATNANANGKPMGTTSSIWHRAVHRTPQWQHMALLSLIDFVYHRILPQCYIPFKYASAVYTARPVLLALPLQTTSSTTERTTIPADTRTNDEKCTRNNISSSRATARDDHSAARRWTKAEIEHALNEVQSGFGSEFVRTPSPESAHTSLFGVHWDNMDVDARSGRVHCHACEMYAHEVAQYQDKVAAMIAHWKSAVRAELPRWKARGMHQMEIDRRTYEMREELIPYTGFYNSNIARRHGDIVIQHVCAHWPSSLAHLEIATLGCKDASQLLMALTADIRKQCHHFVKLKHAMAMHAFSSDGGDGGAGGAGVRRMQYKLGDPWAYLNMWQEEVTTELVAGVSSAGFLCGFLLIEKGE